MRDMQKTRLYQWEDRIIGPRDVNPVDLETAQAIVRHVWQEEGLVFPPVVQALPSQTKRLVGSGSRTVIQLKFPTHTWIVLHEVAHSLNTTLEGKCDHHGPNYLGIYMRLLAKYINVPLPLLMFTATDSKLSFNLSAKYAFVDA